MSKKTVIKNKINREKGIVTVIKIVEETDQNGDVTVTETEEEFPLEEWEKSRNSSHSQSNSQSHSRSQSQSFSQEPQYSQAPQVKKVHFEDAQPSQTSVRNISPPQLSTPQKSTPLSSHSPRPSSQLHHPSTPEAHHRPLPQRPDSTPQKSIIPQNVSSPVIGSSPKTLPPKSILRSSSRPSSEAESQQKMHVSRSSKYESIEFDILFYINLIRTNPKLFIPLLYQRKTYYRDKIYRIPGKIPIRTEEGETAVLDAIEFLKNQHPLEELCYSFGMSQAARDHALDLGLKGLTGSNSSTFPHKNYKDRVETYGFITGHAIAEHISYGSDKAQTIVLDMLIDDGDHTRSHRKHLFSKEWKYVGIGFGEHTKLRTMCVINFCDGYLDTETNINIGKKPVSALNADNLALEDLEDVHYEGVPSHRIKEIVSRGPAPRLGGASLFQAGHDLGISLYAPYSVEIFEHGSLVDIVFTLQKDVELTKLFIINNDKWYEAKEYYHDGKSYYHGRLTKVEAGKVGILYNNTYLIRFEIPSNRQ